MLLNVSMTKSFVIGVSIFTICLPMNTPVNNRNSTEAIHSLAFNNNDKGIETLRYKKSLVAQSSGQGLP